MRKIVAVCATVLWVCIIILYCYTIGRNPFELPPNELGDFLAGTIAPLVFFWFVIGYFQQGEELRQNTEALRLQREEMKRWADHAAELKDLTAEEMRQRQAEQVRAAQPLLVMSNQNKHSQNTELTVYNMGAMATNPVITAEDWDWPVRMDNVGAMAHGDSAAISVQHPAGEYPDFLHLVFNYTDDLGEYRKQRYEYWFEGNRLVKLEVLDE